MNNRFSKEIIEPENNNNKSSWFIFRDNNLLILIDSGKNSQYSIPLIKNMKELKMKPIRTQYLGRFNNIYCYSAEVPGNTKPPQNMSFHNLRRLYGLIDPDLFQLAGYASQIVRWDQTFQYCGRCGAKTINLENERAKICKECGLINYPRLSPAVIVAVIRENKILLARANHFKKDMYSVLAGFVEPGETLEDCVKREVKEEVNIEIKNIRYFGSQSWPFTDSLMVGFIADYKKGELSVDKNEIAEANWFGPNNLPNIPGKFSIARELIDWFIEKR